MIAISPRDQRFIDARRARRRVGLLLFPTILALIVGAWALFFVVLPMSVNPWLVIGRIEQQQLEPGSLTMYAITATILMNVIFALLAGFLILSIAWARHERRYLKMLGQPVPAEAAPSASSEIGSDPNAPSESASDPANRPESP